MSTPTKNTKKRAATAPRKAARSRVKQNGAQPHNNGDGPSVGPNEPYVPPTTVRPPEEIKPVKPEHPVYGTRKVFRYQPRDGSATIDFPAISTVQTNPKFYWKIYAMNEMFQAFEWMILAEVPRDIQERVMDLADSEKAVFFRAWFRDATQPQGVALPGE